jgi:putative ABC transport system permease protein
MRKVAIRGLFARKTRLILTALAVALGVTLIAGTYVFTDTINASFDKIFTAAYAKTDVAVTPNTDVSSSDQGNDAPPMPASVIKPIRQLPQVAQVDGSIFDQHGAILDSKGDPISKGAPNFVASIHDVKQFESFNVAEGHLPTTADEVALDKATAKRHHFKLGGTVDIVDAQPKKTYKVVGLVTVAGVDSYGGAAVALMTLPEAQRMAGKQGMFDQVDVAAKPGTSPDALRAAVRKVVPAKYDVRTGAQEADKQTKDIKDNLSFLTTALLAFAGISLFVGAFIIFNTFSITVAQRAREFALLRTLGASRGQVLRSVLTEGLVLGTLGSVAGLALGVLVAKGLKAMFGLVGFDLPSQGTILESRTIIVSLLVGIIVTLIASLAPALRATRVPPVAALREGVALPETRSSRFMFPISIVLIVLGAVLLVLGLTSSDSTTGLSLTGAGAAATFLGVALLSPKLVVPLAALVGRPLRGVTGRLARENSVRQPGRTASTAAALMIGVALVSFASIFASSANSTISGYIDKGFNGDLVVQNKDGFTPFSANASKTVAAVPGVNTVTSIRMGNFKFRGDDQSVTGVDPATFTKLYNLTKGGDILAKLGPKDVAVEKSFAKDKKIKLGDTLTVRTVKLPALRLKVTGIIEDKSSLLGDMTMSNAGLSQNVGVDQDTYLFLNYDHGVDAKGEKQRVAATLKAGFPQAEALTESEFKDDQAKQLNQLLYMIYALLALAVIVSLFGIVNTLVLSITERTRELGMLRAIGTSRKQLKSMIRQESMIISVIGGILGLVVGVVLSILFTQALDDIKLHVPFISLIVLLVLSALAGIAAAALPARRAAKLDVLDALAYE